MYHAYVLYDLHLDSPHSKVLLHIIQCNVLLRKMLKLMQDMPSKANVRYQFFKHGWNPSNKQLGGPNTKKDKYY